jgi:hypothetical protein
MPTYLIIYVSRKLHIFIHADVVSFFISLAIKVALSLKSLLFESTFLRLVISGVLNLTFFALGLEVALAE